MTLQDFRTVFNTELHKIYPKTEIDAFFFRLIEHQLGFQLTDVFTKQETLINTVDLSMMNSLLSRLKKEEPIQYILGKTDFFGLPFIVNNHVLIPRPETEELVDWVLKIVNEAKWNTNDLNLLDIGTGSGCIPISLIKNLPNAIISALDISNEALEVAQKNAELNKVSINFFQADILTNNIFQEKFDIITSNPPYVKDLEKKEIQNNVLNNEPHLALFVSDENPLIFYNAIADFSLNHLNKNGILFFEINQYLGQETVNLLQEKGFKNVELKQDLFGNDRMIKASL